MDGLYTTADFEAGVSVTYWDGEYADELMAKHFGWGLQ